MQLLTILGICISLKLSLAAPSPPKGFDHHMVVVADDYEVYWNVQDDEITFQVQVKTTGYVGFGISPKGGMAGADIVMAWVKDDLVYFQDRHATGNSQPQIDDEQNWSLIDGTEKDGYTIVTFKRPLVSCDKTNDMDVTGETMRLIYAYHPEDPQDAASVSYHGSKTRGTKSATLLLYGSQRTVSDVPSHTGYFDLVTPAITIPAQETSYWCQAFKMPKIEEKHHIVRFEPVIQAGHEGIVHHMVLYACQHDFNETAHHGLGGLCYQDLMGEVDQCVSTFFAWGIGGPAMNYPDHLGFPIGGGLKPTMVRLEMHYDNPSSKSGMVDSSGIRIYYTPELRQYDSGYMSVGASLNTLVIPPHFPSLTVQSHCTKECLSKTMPEDEDIKVIAVFLHAHLLGVKMRVRHFRDGKELPPIAKDDYYDFNYQDIRILPEEVIVKPTDHIIVECDYGSSDREVLTYGGFGTKDEMCVAFMSYYPKKAFSRCESGMFPVHLAKIVNATVEVDENEKDPLVRLFQFNITAPKQYAYKDIIDVYNSIDWKDSSVRERFQKIVTEENMYIVQDCDDGFKLGGNLLENPFLKTPKIKETYKPPVRPCSAGYTVTTSSFLVILILQTFVTLMM